MMVDEKETRNSDGCVGATTGSEEGGLLLDGSSGGVSVGEGTSAEGSRIIYKRRKRRKTMSSSDEKMMTEFCDMIMAGEGSASDHDVPGLSFDASPNGPDKWSLRHCRNIVLPQMHQSRNGYENGVVESIRNSVTTCPESGCTPVIKESLDSVERSDNQTHNSAKEVPLPVSSRLSNQSEGPILSKLCELAFSDILTSDKFSELRGLLLKNFGIVNVNHILDLDAINTKIKNGAYETSSMLYHNDIRQVWTKLQQVGNEIVLLANSLSEKSAHYEQFARKPKSTEACGPSNCHGCGRTAHPQNCLVCDSCEEIYHVSCTDLLGPEMPPKTWYCARCTSNGMGSPHDNCTVCEKLKSTASVSRVNGLLTNGEQDSAADGSDPELPELTDDCQGSKTCFICKTEVNTGDNFRTCGHALCAHKFYHYKCLTSKQLGVCGPCWYCPSCLCRRCMIDKDDDQIVLCDGCDQAYHIYCTTPQLYSIPKGRWFCGKCARELKRIKTMKRLYENIQMKVKVEVEEGSEKPAVVDGGGDGDGDGDNSGGLEMLVTAAKTLSHQETMDRYP